MKCGRLLVARSDRCGSAWLLSAPAGVSSLGFWAAGAPRCSRGFGRRCPVVPFVTCVTLLIFGVSTRRYCRLLLTASLRPLCAWFRLLTVICGTVVACSSSPPVCLASVVSDYYIYIQLFKFIRYLNVYPMNDSSIDLILKKRKY